MSSDTDDVDESTLQQPSLDQDELRVVESAAIKDNDKKRRQLSRRASRAAPPSKLREFSKFLQLVFNAMQTAGSKTAEYLRRVFTLPLRSYHPISYSRSEDFDKAGKLIDKGDQEEYEKKMDMLEALCNYNQEMKVKLEMMLHERKEFLAATQKKASSIDWSKFPPWTESYLGHLESTFRVFDASGDELIDFDEMSVMLTDYGDKTPLEERDKVFQLFDPSRKGALSFSDFVHMFHDITVKSPDSYPSTIVDSFRSIDRNMARIRGLDVVQQLQTGLF